MKRLVLIGLALLPFLGTSPALAASWTEAIQGAIKNGDFAQIDVVAAKNPEQQGDIAMYLLQQSQNSALNEGTRVKLFASTMPFGSQIPLSDAGEASTIIGKMLNLAGDPDFQKKHTHDANDIITTALSLTSEPNIVTANPNLHNLAVAEADDFATNNPGEVDKKLKDQVDLALQIGLPPPLGPRGIINPSQE